MKTNLGFYFCIVLVPCFWIISFIFGIYKEKAAKLISGFNMLPEREQEQYDKARMAKDVRDQSFLWGAIMAAGALCSFIWSYAAVPAYCIWLILFFQEVHLDARKAFEKYRK